MKSILVEMPCLSQRESLLRFGSEDTARRRRARRGDRARRGRMDTPQRTLAARRLPVAVAGGGGEHRHRSRDGRVRSGGGGVPPRGEAAASASTAVVHGLERASRAGCERGADATQRGGERRAARGEEKTLAREWGCTHSLCVVCRAWRDVRADATSSAPHRDGRPGPCGSACVVDS